MGRHPDYPHSIPYADKLVVAVVMHRSHSGAPSIVIQEITAEVDRMCSPGRARLSTGTGLTRLSNGILKNSDAGLFSHEGGKSSLFPGIVAETNFSDPEKKSRQDIRLWLDYSDYSVKLGIACTIAVNQQKQFTKLLLQLFTIDSSDTTREVPLGRSQKCAELDFSAYDGTPQTLPAITTFSIPSYYVFTNGRYPTSYPAHPNPPALLPPATNIGRQYKLSLNQLSEANRNIDLENTQRAPIVIDFTYIADLIREIDWNV